VVAIQVFRITTGAATLVALDSCGANLLPMVVVGVISRRPTLPLVNEAFTIHYSFPLYVLEFWEKNT
jgi:hypothetical protein